VIQLRAVILDQLYNKLSRTSALVTRQNALRVAINRLVRAGVSGDYGEQVCAVETQLQAKMDGWLQ
jgi:hypothetical protein